EDPTTILLEILPKLHYFVGCFALEDGSMPRLRCVLQQLSCEVQPVAWRDGPLLHERAKRSVRVIEHRVLTLLIAPEGGDGALIVAADVSRTSKEALLQIGGLQNPADHLRVPLECQHRP